VFVRIENYFTPQRTQLASQRPQWPQSQHPQPHQHRRPQPQFKTLAETTFVSFFYLIPLSHTHTLSIHLFILITIALCVTFCSVYDLTFLFVLITIALCVLIFHMLVSSPILYFSSKWWNTQRTFISLLLLELEFDCVYFNLEIYFIFLSSVNKHGIHENNK
jgi:hypothetical protein